MSEKITTGLGEFDASKLQDLVKVREAALIGLRDALNNHGFHEVTTSSLVNIAGSCENPNASFTLNYYGRDAHLSQSAQLQLESLVARLWGSYFTVNNSFREEHFDDPEQHGRRLSEFTLVEAERRHHEPKPEKILAAAIKEHQKVIKHAVGRALFRSHEIDQLGGNHDYLIGIFWRRKPLPKITYSDAIKLLKSEGFDIEHGNDLGIREERAILRYFNNIPTYVTHHPDELKFFNTKRADDGTAYSFDLLAPALGEIAGGAVREEDGEKVRKQLVESRVGKYLIERGQDPEKQFAEYLALFSEPTPARAGYGIGFERFVAFLIGSNDILNTVAYRTIQP